jgi:methionyl aminopeptidase
VERKVEENNFSVVRDLVGHGIGRRMHEEPAVPNFGQPGTGMEIKPGLVCAIEPMVNLGGFSVAKKRDGWTIVTKDGEVSVHFEHTVAATVEGPLVLTQL